MSAMSPWRNRLARSAVNRKVGGSSPPGDAFFFLLSLFLLLFFFPRTPITFCIFNFFYFLFLIFIIDEMDFKNVRISFWRGHRDLSISRRCLFSQVSEADIQLNLWGIIAISYGTNLKNCRTFNIQNN